MEPPKIECQKCDWSGNPEEAVSDTGDTLNDALCHPDIIDAEDCCFCPQCGSCSLEFESGQDFVVKDYVQEHYAPCGPEHVTVMEIPCTPDRHVFSTFEPGAVCACGEGRFVPGEKTF